MSDHQRTDWETRSEARIRSLRPSLWVTADAKFILERLDQAKAQIKRMQDFLCERGLYADYYDWIVRGRNDD